MLLPEAGRHAVDALQNDEAAQILSDLATGEKQASVPGADVELVSIRKCDEKREDKSPVNRGC
jgi:hypothetical protein